MKEIDFSVGESTRRRLEAALERPSHAYIVSGPQRSAVHALADRVAAAFVCSGTGKRPCGTCAHCRKAEGGIHPDILRVSIPADKRSISVEQVRAMRADAYIRPNEAERKVFIIEDAQTMRDEAQNALLKVLEEGPAYAAFLLLTEHPQQLLATIRSRCEVLSLTTGEDERPAELSDELRQAARELAGLMLSENETALVEYTVALEQKKWDRDTLSAFLVAVEESLHAQLRRDSARVLPRLEHLKRLRQATAFNIGNGHLLGWLAAGR